MARAAAVPDVLDNNGHAVKRGTCGSNMNVRNNLSVLVPIRITNQ